MRVVTRVRGQPIYLAQHFYDVPVPQPRDRPRGADMTGLKLWYCALPLLAHLEASALLAARGPRMPRVLELGAGTGLLGIGLAATGAAEVVLTDPAIPINLPDERPSNTLAELAANIERNAHAVGDRACARKLLWGDAGDIAALRDEFGSERPFDLIVGSDLLYDTDGYAPLVATLRALAPSRRADDRGSSPGAGAGAGADAAPCAVVLAHPQRHAGEARFFELAREAFDVQTGSINTESGTACVLTRMHRRAAAPRGEAAGSEPFPLDGASL